MAIPTRPATPWCRVAMYGVGYEKEWSNDFWYQPSVSVIPGSFNPAQLANDAFTVLVQLYIGMQSTAITVKGANAEVNFGAGTYGGDYYQSAAGTITGDPMPADVSAVVTKLTAKGGKTGRGHWRFCGLSDADCTGSYLNASGLGHLNGVTPILMAPVISQGVNYTPFHFSKKLQTFEPLVGVDVIAMLGTVRRRRGRF